MNKTELVGRIKPAGASNAVAESMLDALGKVVQEALANGDEVTLPGIGKLTVKQRAGRPGRNPATGEALDIPAKTVPHFSAAKALKDAVA